MRAAQILLSHEDLSDRTRYLNARSTLQTLLELGAMPVVNENDTVPRQSCASVITTRWRRLWRI